MEFKRLSEVTLVENATDIANVLIEEEGEIKRVPKTQVGGAGGGIPTAIIKPIGLDDLLQNGNSESYDPMALECTNMTFEEAIAIIASGNPLNFIVIVVTEEALMQINANAIMSDGEYIIQFMCSLQGEELPFIWDVNDTISMQLPPA